MTNPADPQQEKESEAEVTFGRIAALGVAYVALASQLGREGRLDLKELRAELLRGSNFLDSPSYEWMMKVLTTGMPE